MLAKSFIAAAFAGMAAAQNTGVEVIPVLVGMSPNGTAGTFFSPESITAPVGSMVQFQFMGGNHTVTQAAFSNPCQPLSSTNASAVGFHSDFVPAANNAQTGKVPSYTIQIKDTRPIWAYCAQGRHCQSGMVMVINENTAATPENSLANFKAAAASVEQATVPGPNGGAATGNGGGQTGGNGGNAGNADANTPAAGANLRVPAYLLAAVAGAAALF
ncbi:uncharacterized protein DNG_05985 [Cephalotrichum gorgonifer]|uniref:Extracellular serine-rich protein n=1 Tax=Cephalotrichum gorgonifer TaxID=2041049 RepID=A0AAE8N0V1_9PEZI|nr:uncharacterized protein DNG_05985 [Cephalotrichum gorgonifer]